MENRIPTGVIVGFKNRFRPVYRQLKREAKFLSYVLRGKTNAGFCPVCEKNTQFIKYDSWLRDNYRCVTCYSIPRQRALINSLTLFFPDWPDLTIHESSPGGVSSDFIRKKCRRYSASQYYPDVTPGAIRDGFQCQNLERLTFADRAFDLVISQDVFEHVLNPDRAFTEIARVLKPGGAHVFTMPWYPGLKQTVRRAVEVGGTVRFLEEPVYHGNPVDAKGSLVTFDWGLDFPEYVFRHGGLVTTIHLVMDENKGLNAQFLEVFISRKIE
ncbi:MAG: class I SAM-dependent methyltransferase [Ferruginibacter sp.]|nr:class I SAM-dependent methyltransferase [Cytophagales bacterium]